MARDQTQSRGKGGKKDAKGKADSGALFAEAWPAEVKEVITRAGSRGGLSQVMALILDGRDKNKAIRRNVKGPVRKGDILMLLDTEIEAQRLGGRKRRK